MVIKTHSVAIPFDDWLDSGEAYVEETKDAGCDMLALVCSLYRDGKKSKDIYEAIEQMCNNNSFSETVEQCDIDLADSIRKFYRQKLMLKRLATEDISEFDKIVEWIVSNPEHLYKQSHLRPLVKLPVFYIEDSETKDIIKNHTSVPEKCADAIHCSITYVGCVRKNISRGEYISYYFSTPDNHLLKVVAKVDIENTAPNLWDSILKTNKNIKIDTPVNRERIPGETFYVYEIRDARKMIVYFI